MSTIFEFPTCTRTQKSRMWTIPKCYIILPKKSALQLICCCWRFRGGGESILGGSPSPAQYEKEKQARLVYALCDIKVHVIRTGVTALVLYSSELMTRPCVATVQLFVCVISVFQCRCRCRCRTVVRRRRRRALSTCASRPSPSTAASTARRWRTCCKYNVVLTSLLTERFTCRQLCDCAFFWRII